MRTARCSSRLRGLSAWLGHLTGGGCLPGGCLPWGCLPGEVSAHGGVCLGQCLPGGSTSGLSPRGGTCPGGCLPRSPVNRIRDACENITLPQLRCGRQQKCILWPTPHPSSVWCDIRVFHSLYKIGRNGIIVLLPPVGLDLMQEIKLLFTHHLIFGLRGTERI